METQKEKVRRLSDEIINLEPKSMYSRAKLRELGSVMRTEDADTAIDVCIRVNMNMTLSASTSFGAYFAGLMAIVGPGLDSVVKDFSSLTGWAYLSVGVALAFAGRRARFEGVKVKENLDMVIKEAQRQHDELKSRH